MLLQDRVGLLGWETWDGGEEEDKDRKCDRSSDRETQMSEVTLRKRRRKRRRWTRGPFKLQMQERAWKGLGGGLLCPHCYKTVITEVHQLSWPTARMFEPSAFFFPGADTIWKRACRFQLIYLMNSVEQIRRRGFLIRRSVIRGGVYTRIPGPFALSLIRSAMWRAEGHVPSSKWRPDRAESLRRDVAVFSWIPVIPWISWNFPHLTKLHKQTGLVWLFHII